MPVDTPPDSTASNAPDSEPQRPLAWPYEPIFGYYDEMLASAKQPRSHWRGLMSQLENFSPVEFDKRWARGKQIIHENGVTYTVYGEDQAADRAWQLDPIPLVISAEEWKTIEEAVTQRARLLNMILADVYGQQRLFNERLLPAATILSQPAYVRPMLGVNVPFNIYSHLHAVDLARSPDGQWWVVGDRTQAPSGMGYALENRSVINRILTEPFQNCRVTRLADFFGHLNDMILSLAPAHKENPRIVLLTPGVYNETYFEHAYLARYLGYTLAEGRDLTVRDARVYLKTLSGLLPVDVILRRTDELFCDPLELREDSVLGIPGLLQAIRAGHVAIANALGSGLVQAPSLLPFLPGLCRKLLGEELKLPPLATWWCGQAKPMEWVINNLSKVVIKSAIAGSRTEPVFGEELNATQREQLISKIRKSPRSYIAQEQVRLSTTPTWTSTGLTPRHAMVRVFAAAKPDGSYVVMPGGLGRVSGSTESTVVSMQRGGGSKDTWVLSEGPVSTANPFRPPGAPVEITRAGIVLSSRIADELFWLGRYIERTEYGIRVARSMLRPSFNDISNQPDLLLLLAGKTDPADVRPVWSRMIEPLFGYAPGTPSLRCVRHDIEQLHRISGNVRDRISTDAWRVIAKLEEIFTRPISTGAALVNQTFDLLERSMILVAAFTGQTADSMTRDKGWRFLDTGRRIERSLHIVELLRWAFIGAGKGLDRLDTILDISNSSRIYRSRYLTTVQLAPVLDLLLLDETNPQSLAFQLARALENVEQFPLEPEVANIPEDRRILLRLLANVRLTQVESIFETSSIDPQNKLADLLAELNMELPHLSDAISRLYLSHVRVSHQSRGGVK